MEEEGWNVVEDCSWAMGRWGSSVKGLWTSERRSTVNLRAADSSVSSVRATAEGADRLRVEAKVETRPLSSSFQPGRNDRGSRPVVGRSGVDRRGKG